MSFKEWFDTNWYSNCFTMITVVLSGIVSLIISAVYYHKGNRNNLKMSVIYPIVRLLKTDILGKITIHYARFPRSIVHDI